MVWGIFLKFSHSCNISVKCFTSRIVVGSDWMDLQQDKSNIYNDEMHPMVWGTSLTFSHSCNNNWIKCFKSPIVVGSNSMDLQSDKSNTDNEEMFPML